MMPAGSCKEFVLFVKSVIGRHPTMAPVASPDANPNLALLAVCILLGSR